MEKERKHYRAPSREGMVGYKTHIPKELKNQLSLLALSQKKSQQELTIEAIEMVIAKNKEDLVDYIENIGKIKEK